MKIGDEFLFCSEFNVATNSVILSQVKLSELDMRLMAGQFMVEGEEVLDSISTSNGLDSGITSNGYPSHKQNREDFNSINNYES